MFQKSEELLLRAVDPIAGPPEEPSDGLLYGLIQSGKTSVITVAAAMAADNAFQCIIILTPDNELLYEQTLERVKAGLRGISVLGKRDWKDQNRFARQLRTLPFAIVCSKNPKMLGGLSQAFQTAKARGLSVLIFDDEADQASLNTHTRAGKGRVSEINRFISEIRTYFPVNTYLQVTATPQALFLQRPGHRYRPAFSVLAEPGGGYLGGNAFFGNRSASLLRDVPLDEVAELSASRRAGPTAQIPDGLRTALLTFLMSASHKTLERPNEGFAFLCHVSASNKDHDYLVTVIESFKEEVANALSTPSSPRFRKLISELQKVYTDLSNTEPALYSFEDLLEQIRFYIRGATTKLVNAVSGDEISLDSVYNFFVGGNKLGRGVTIRNLLVSYYGRNPKTPNADTVLQHARMYGYRERDAAVTRLFLPSRLAHHFFSIHEMETALRDLVEKHPDGGFEGIYISGSWKPTRANVLDPDSIGYYVAGRSYNPSYPLSDSSAFSRTAELDSRLSGAATHGFQITTVDEVIRLIKACPADRSHPVELWNMEALEAALSMRRRLAGDKAYLVVRRGRHLKEPRRETQGILSGGEETLAPTDAVTLFMFRQEPVSAGAPALWWPQLRFADGNYVMAFSFDWNRTSNRKRKSRSV